MAAFSIRSNGGIMFVLLVAFTMGTWVTSAEDFTLTILHTNDIHARIDEFDAKGSRCDDALRSTRSCYGGIARQKYMVGSGDQNLMFVYEKRNKELLTRYVIPK